MEKISACRFASEYKGQSHHPVRASQKQSGKVKGSMVSQDSHTQRHPAFLSILHACRPTNNKGNIMDTCSEENL